MGINIRKNAFRNTVLAIDVVVLTVLGYVGQKVYQKWLVETDKRETVELLQIYKESIEQIFYRRLTLVGGLEKFVIDRNDAEINRDFSLYASGLYNDSSGVRNVAVGPKGILTLIYPIQGNEQAINYNLLTDEAVSVRSDINRALESKGIVVSDPFVLRQKGLGIAARKAIFKRGSFWGIVSMVLDVPKVIEQGGLDKASEKHSLALKDKSGNVFWGEKELFSLDPVVVRIDTIDGFWELGGMPSNGWKGEVSGAVKIVWFWEVVMGLIVLGTAYLLVDRWWGITQSKFEWKGMAEITKPVLWYLAFGILWIIFSDRLIEMLVSDPKIMTKISIVKGWLFVIFSGALFYLWSFQALIKSSNLINFLHRTQEVAKLGYYSLDIESGIWEPSEKLKELMGIDDTYFTDVAGWLNLVHPDQRDEMREYFEKEVLEKRRPFDKEYKLINRSTLREFWVHGLGVLDLDSKGVPIRMVGTIQDITEKKQMENILIESNRAIKIEKQKLETVLKDMGDAVFVVDKRGIITMVNKAGLKMTGYKEAELLGKSCREKLKTVSEKTKKEMECLVDVVLKKEVAVESGDSMVLITNKGNKIAINGVATPLKDVYGEVNGAVVVIRDESKQRAISKLKTDFISLASHQLRTPLTGIKWFIELMRKNAKEKPGEYQKDFINKIEESNRTLIELVDDLLAVGRADEGKLDDKKLENCSIRMMIEEAARLQEQLYLDNKITLEGLESIPKEYCVKVDRVQMIQVFSNLLNNAARYSAKGSKVRVWVEKKGKDYLIMFKDEGAGIPKSQQSRVFEKFFRAENVAKTTSGTGLGLYLTKSMIEGHGGEVKFNSVEGKGSTFIIRLPIKQKKNG